MSSTLVLSSADRDAEDKGPAIIATICAVTALETLFCAARIYTRGRILGRLQLDDYLIMVSVVMGWSSVAFSVLAVKSGNGKHFDLLTTDQKSGAILWTMVGFCPGILSFGIPKLAVIALLTRLLNPGRIHKIFLWCLGVVCILSLLGCVVVLFGRCMPARSLWDFSVTPESCFSVWILVDYAIYAGSFSAFTDLYLAVYPATVLFTLQMNLRKKLALAAALGVGSIATVIAVYKTTRLPSLASDDFSYDTSDLVVWTAVEGATIIIAACIPVLQPFIDKIVSSRIFSSFSGSRGGRGDRAGYNSYGAGKDYPATIGGSGHVRSQGDGGIELSNSRNRKRGVKDPNGLTFLDETRAGSEESILKNGSASSGKDLPSVPEGGRGGGMGGVEEEGRSMDGSSVGGGHHHEVLPASQQGGAGIVRTDVVSVSYGQQPSGTMQGMKDGSRWNAWSSDAGRTGRAA